VLCLYIQKQGNNIFMENLVNKTEALKAIKQGKKVKNGTSIFKGLGIDKDVIVDQTGFNYTEYFKLSGNHL
jgi:hypothetical protein